VVIHKYNPTSPGRRQGTVIHDGTTAKRAPEKSLLETVHRTAGRNGYGRITSRRRGGGHKRRYRIIDWRRRFDGVPAKVAALEYDPNRSARIALLALRRRPQGLHDRAQSAWPPGATVESGPMAEPRVGNALPPLARAARQRGPLRRARARPRAQLGRSAGCVIRLASRDGDYASVILPSGEMRKVHVDCRATIGQVGNSRPQRSSRSARPGRNRHKNRRPTVRGSAMSAYAHPLGGGEGRTGAGREPCSPWGKLAKGGKSPQPSARPARASSCASARSEDAPDMSRSLKKGPFVDAQAREEGPAHDARETSAMPDHDRARASTITRPTSWATPSWSTTGASTIRSTSSRTWSGTSSASSPPRAPSAGTRTRRRRPRPQGRRRRRRPGQVSHACHLPSQPQPQRARPPARRGS
jgi:large subunit ribosomal protein L2